MKLLNRSHVSPFYCSSSGQVGTRSIEVGDSVYLNRDGRLFVVEVTAINGETIKGTVQRSLDPEILRLEGEEIEFQEIHCFVVGKAH